MEAMIGDILEPLAVFGGIALVIWASAKAKLEHRKLDMRLTQPQEARSSLPDSSVAAELKALRQQMAEMQSTGHQFDISFDAALERLEGRVNRLETKSAVSGTSGTAEMGQTLRNGQSQ